ncbi:hypothetical protein [Blastococcus sp. URHD0036]|uniref:hypothetical protein n=1 Tax=Blastococcus sp. URHD0036 TaxID=1380356 RepID=UPI000495BC4E|nr:hypothetical protein [Blastococcus sp. URHD0036]
MWLLNCLCAAIPARERVVTCEQVFELQLAVPVVASSLLKRLVVAGDVVEGQPLERDTGDEHR